MIDVTKVRAYIALAKEVGVKEADLGCMERDELVAVARELGVRVRRTVYLVEGAPSYAIEALAPSDGDRADPIGFAPCVDGVLVRAQANGPDPTPDEIQKARTARADGSAIENRGVTFTACRVGVADAA